jgi:hypothetical protein
MDAALIGMGIFLVTQFGLIWYRLGKLEQQIGDACGRLNKLNGIGK